MVDIVCASCGEPFTYDRPPGTPGRPRRRCDRCTVNRLQRTVSKMDEPRPVSKPGAKRVVFVKKASTEVVAPQPVSKPAPLPDLPEWWEPYDPDESLQASLDRLVTGPLGRVYRESMKRIDAEGHPDSVLLLNVARRIDRGTEGGSAHAALVRECRALANTVFAGSAHAPDVLDELQQRRAGRAERTG